MDFRRLSKKVDNRWYNYIPNFFFCSEEREVKYFSTILGVALASLFLKLIISCMASSFSPFGLRSPIAANDAKVIISNFIDVITIDNN